MRELLFEILLRLVKPLLATLIAVVAWGLAVGLAGTPPTLELAILLWLAGAAFILLAQESPL
jgi:hypothetical protein